MYQTTPVETVFVENAQSQEPTLTDKAKDIIQQVGEKIGIVQSPTVVPVSSPSHLTGPLAEISEVRAEMGLSNTVEIQKPLADRAKETLDQVSATIEPIAEKVKDSFYQAGETLGFVQPVQNIEGPLAEIQDIRKDMGKSRMEPSIQKPLSERAKETWNEAGERIEPYAERARETLTQMGETLEPYVEKSKETLYQAGEKLGFIKPVQNIEGPLAEIQDVRQDMGWSRMEQPIQKPLSVRAKETWNEAGERIEPYAEIAKESFHRAGESITHATEVVKETWNEAGEKIEPYAEKAKESLYQAGETIGIIKPVQNIEGPLAEIQDVRQDMGLSRMEQPYERPLSVRAKETWKEASDKIEPYAEKARETLKHAGETIEPYAEKARETLIYAGEKIEPYVEKSKESLHHAGEALGFIKPVQNIEGPLAEIQDVRQDMGMTRMEQPIERPLTERAKETWNEAGERAKETLNEAGDKARETLNEAGERIEPYAEKAKDSLNEAGEKIGLVKPAQKIEGPLAEIQDVRQDMGMTKMEQPYQKPLTQRAKETFNEAGEKAKETFNEAGEKAKEKLNQAGEQIGLVDNFQNVNVEQKTPFVGKNMKPTAEKIQLYSENAGDDFRPVVDEVGNISKGYTGETEKRGREMERVEKTKVAPQNTLESSTKTLPA